MEPQSSIFLKPLFSVCSLSGISATTLLIPLPSASFPRSFDSSFTGMHAIKDKPVVVNGEIVIRPIMVVALTYDHRLLDGREAVTFLGEYSFFLWIRVFAVQVR